MPETSKHSLIVPTLMKILLVIGVIAGFTACQESPNTTSKISSSNTSHVVLVDASLAHTYKSLKDLKRDSTLIVLGTVISQSMSIGNHGIPYTTSVLNVKHTLVGKLTKEVQCQMVNRWK